MNLISQIALFVNPVILHFLHFFHSTILKCDENYKLAGRRNEWESIFPSARTGKILRKGRWEQNERQRDVILIYIAYSANKAPFSVHAAFHSSFIVDLTRQASSFAFHFRPRLSSSASTVGAALFQKILRAFSGLGMCAGSLSLMFYVPSRRTFSTLRSEITFLCFTFSALLVEKQENPRVKVKIRHSSSFQWHSSHNDGLIVAQYLPKMKQWKQNFIIRKTNFLPSN